ncbi:MAG: RNA 3'-terminal phosphate cyclase [Candidatus Odinarchaeota archaeon]
MIEIDGSVGEGGGQILRTSLSLSALLGKPVRIYNIRINRPNPGLRPQHMSSVKVLSELTGADLKGLEEGSTELLFSPKGGSFKDTVIDIGTAGSVSLLLQTITPYCIFAGKPVKLRIIGGTDVKWSPPIDYVKYVFTPMLSKMNIHLTVNLVKRGFYPKGGGIVDVIFNPCEGVKPILIGEQSRVIQVKGVSYAANLPDHVVRRQAESAVKIIKESGLISEKTVIEIFQEHPSTSLSPGSGIVLYANMDRGGVIGSDALGERGVPAEKVGETAAAGLISQLKTMAGVDGHMSDMIIPYLGLAKGFSKIYTSNVTLHAMTNIMIVEKFLDVKFTVTGGANQPSYIEVEGVGFNHCF